MHIIFQLSVNSSNIIKSYKTKKILIINFIHIQYSLHLLQEIRFICCERHKTIVYIIYKTNERLKVQ